MNGKLRSFFAKIGQFHRDRLVANISTQTKEENDVSFQANFEVAKRLSDFVGMIVRFSFCQAATIYFYQKSNNPDIIKGLIFTFCAISSLGLLLVLGSRIFMIILMYESKDVRKFTSKFGKVLFFFLALLNSLALWYGVSAMLSDLRKSIGS